MCSQLPQASMKAQLSKASKQPSPKYRTDVPSVCNLYWNILSLIPQE